MLFSRGPRLSKASIRSKYWRTSSTEVTSPRSIACWSSGIVWPRASKRSPCIVSAAASARMVSTVIVSSLRVLAGNAHARDAVVVESFF